MRPQFFAPYLLSVLRIMTGLLFLQHPFAKFFGIPHVAAFDNLRLFSLVGLAGVIELVGSILIIAGFYTRKFLHIGERLEISGNAGMLKAINATHTILQSGEREVSVANAAFLETSAISWMRTE